jgi:outer membrane protein OmpA-like peptidoglycan-associated protein
MKNNILSILFIISVLSIFAQEETQTERFLIKSLEVNNAFQNFGTTFYGKNKVVFSTQNKKDAFLDLVVGDISKNGEITNAQKLKGINSKYHESNLIFSKNLKKVYFSRSIKGETNTIKLAKDRDARIAILTADIGSGNQWENIKLLPFNNKKYDVGHPTINKEGTKMYFTSNMPGTLGLTDIFVVDIHSDGTYGVPKNMGPKVNSIHKEMFPYIDKNNVLFFSSNRPDGGYGGLDIYAVKEYESGEISDRIHLEPPVNSIGDDFNYIFNEEEKEGYFSSNRSTGKGSDDIYFFTETRPLVFDCYQEINGLVIDAQTKKPLSNASVTLMDANGEVIKNITTENDGKFSFDQAVCDTGYELLGEKKYYAKKLKKFNTTLLHNNTNTFTLELSDSFIVKKRGKQMLNIDVINFDFDSAKIRPDAANQLNRVVNTMTRYPKMVIELGAHTDARGKDLYNLILSSKRARSVINYITTQGISSNRISGKGYGEKMLINNCKNGVKCTNKEHELNRRSEFVITKM